MKTIEKLRKKGFDKTVRVGRNKYHIACSQCVAVVIQGIPCHEHGCPNRSSRDTYVRFNEEESDFDLDEEVFNAIQDDVDP